MSRPAETSFYKGVWPYLRLAIFWIAGVRSTVFAAPDQPQWEFWVGCFLLALAVVDSALIVRRFLNRRAA